MRTHVIFFCPHVHRLVNVVVLNGIDVDEYEI